MTLEKALKTPVRSAVISIFGYDWESAKAACTAFALPHSTYRARTADRGMTPEEAIRKPTARGYKGYSMEEVKSICQTYAIGKSRESEFVENDV